ncbi:MAG: hypothetical protein M0Z80_14860 [Treponema sp.]|nr:hypothetical protein [Treponema sp.]
MRRLIASLGLLIVALTALSAEPAVPGFYLDQNLQASYNPLGLQLGTKLFYRLPLVEKEGILWESTKIDIGMANSLSPAYDFIGAYLDIEPIAIFDIAFAAQFAGYYDGLGYGFHDLSGYGASFDSAALNSLPSKNATGYLLSAAPTLKFAFGAFAFADTLHITYFDVDGGRGYFYETYANCALAKSDTELYNDCYALLKLAAGIRVGLNDSILFVPSSGYRSHTIQAVGVISRNLSRRLSFYAALTAGTYLEDRYYRYEPRVAGMAGITSAL